ncbi:hypothetical protein ACQ4PT_026770 [Festuca glaucescens]
MSSEGTGEQLSGSTQFSESPEISSGREQSVERGSDGLEEEVAEMEEEAGNPDQDAGLNLAAYTRGAWKGSDVSQAEIDWLYRSRRIPEEVFCRIPGKEREPTPEPGEVVVFTAHFERGFGLPASDFFRRFLDFYELQPHHLPANAIFYLSSFVSFMEGFVGLLPTVETFARFYNLRINSIQDPQLPTPKPVVQCGACILTPRQGSPFYRFTGLESCRAWQETFFYVRNAGTSDFINLPAYLPGAPARTNWRFNPKEGHVETNRIIRFMKGLNDNTNISSDDIVRAFISRRVLPLQRRAHKIGQMSGRRDPTRITTFGLRKPDVVLKAKQICKTKMPPNWKWGLQPLSRKRPPSTQVLERFPRILAEVPESFEPKRLFPDDTDPDPYVPGNVHKMGPTHSRRPAPADQSPQASAHTTPPTAEVGDPPASRVRKAPVPEAGPSGAPASKRQKVTSSGPPRKKKRDAIPTSFGPALTLSRSASGMRPEALQDFSQQHVSQQSPAHSGAGQTHSSPRGGGTSSGSAAPKPRHHRAEDFTSPPDTEDTGAGDMGAGSEPSGRSGPPVPPALAKTKQIITASPRRASSTLARSSPAKGTTASPPASASKPPPAPQQGSRKSTEVNAEELSAVITAAATPASGSQERTLVLHTGRAAITAGEKVSAQLGRIVELNRGDANLGGLQHLVDRWNLADLTDATRGVGKDGKVVVDSRGPRSTVQHFGRLKQAVKEFDNAWHDANQNVLGVLDSRKQVFEELLWEHRDLTEAHSTLQLTHSQCRAEKEKLALQHQQELKAQRDETAKLKDQLIQAGLQQAEALKGAIAAGEAKLKEARKQFAGAEERLRQELGEEKNLREMERDRNAVLAAAQASLCQMIKDTDAKALKLFPNSQERAVATVSKIRTENSVSDAETAWTAEDHLAALYSRITHMRIVERQLVQLPEAAVQIFKRLWPGEAVPDDLNILTERLLGAGRRLSEWRHSAARAGADIALRFACSWYEGLDLDALHSLREGAPTDIDPAKTAARRARAYHLASYASTSTFIPPPADLAEEYTDDEEEEREAADDETETNVEADAPESTAGNSEQAPEAPEAPERAPETSSPLYQ